MLAIAAPTFYAPSETFIRDHVRTIAPQATVLISQKGADAEVLGCPVITGIPSAPIAPTSLSQRVRQGIGRRWRTYVSPELATSDREKVVEFLRQHSVRVMLAEYGSTAAHFVRACREADVALYAHFHGFDASMNLRMPHWVRHYRRLFKYASGIIVPCRFLAAKLAGIGCPSRKLHVVHFGINVERFQPAPGIPFRLLAVGRLVEKKAPHVTIKAFAEVLTRFPKATLDIIGDGMLREICEAVVRKNGLDDKVRLLGVQPSEQVVNAMREASLFVQHSVTGSDGDSEGLPVAILEAMSSGLPVVATRHSGIPEAVIEGKTGILVDEYDVSGMANAIGDLLANPSRAKSFGETGRRRVLAHFTQKQTRDRLCAIMGL